MTADEAAIKTAELNLEYCTIKSPIDGRTGALMVKAGNLVKVADVPIVVINQVNPIYVDFTVPQQYLPDVKRYMAQGTLRVLATVPGDPAGSEEGTLTFVDNAVDPTTGTIHLKATFTNSRNSLWPGLYVNTTLTLSQQAAATVVPLQAIVASQKGPSVYVVKSDNTVESRPVVSPRTVQGEAVIDKGLQPGETVVTDGQTRLIPGRKSGNHQCRRTGGSRSESGTETREGEKRCGHAREHFCERRAGQRGWEHAMNIPETFIKRPGRHRAGDDGNFAVRGGRLSRAAGERSCRTWIIPRSTWARTCPARTRTPWPRPSLCRSKNSSPTIAGLDSMVSSNRVGATSIVLQFSLDRNLDGAAQDVQAAISQAAKQLPPNMPAPPSYSRFNPGRPAGHEHRSDFGHAAAFRGG